MRLAASTPLQTIFGYGSADRAGPVSPIEATRQIRRGNYWSLEDQAFGATVIREAKRDQEPLLYGPDAKLKKSDSDTIRSEEEMGVNDKALLEKLRDRDSLVRRHETEHIMTGGGQISGPAQYTYQTGPDGRQYAIGGSVNVSIVSSPMDNEDAAKQAETALRAATANGEMSLQDMQVAMRATELYTKARDITSGAYSNQLDLFA